MGLARARCAGSGACRARSSSRAGFSAASGPTSCWGWAATRRGRWCSRRRCSGYPTAIQEQNSLPGFTNRVLGRFVRRVFVAFDEAASAFARRKVRLVGNPVRRRFLERAAAVAGRDADRRQTSIVILGGSQGSHAVNELASGMVRVLDARGRLPPIVHQTGPDELERMQVHYAAFGYEGRVDVRAFIDDMPAVLADAALVVARAGALTLAELAIMRRPAILIPLPDRRRRSPDHQRARLRARRRGDRAAAGRRLRDPPRRSRRRRSWAIPRGTREHGRGHGDARAAPHATRRHRRRAVRAIARSAGVPGWHRAGVKTR